MPEVVNNRKIFSLREVAASIEKTLAERYQSAFWIKAEINKLNYYPRSGHAYPDLVEKKDGKILAEVRANIWKGEFNRINQSFLSILKEPLKDGISVLCCVKINFHAVHGLSLNIIDIDVSFALGELEKDKLESIAGLKAAQLFDANKKLPFPLLPKRIAIISVETSKGYADFLNILNNNPRGYGFYHLLFPALLQGENAVFSIINQLNRIKTVAQHFDVVAIIRGGGGEVGLSCFNNYNLAKTVATFPIPVLSGIGHATNETVTEMVAYKNAITPTDLADFLINKLHQVAEPLERLEERLVSNSKSMLREQQQSLSFYLKLFRSASFQNISKNKQQVSSMSANLAQQCRLFLAAKAKDLNLTGQMLSNEVKIKFANEEKELIHIERNISMIDPQNVLKRGYSITLKKGKAVKKKSEVSIGEQISTLLKDGELTSTINEIK
jgi:exodeoxyribonuclease VII large subunit